MTSKATEQAFDEAEHSAQQGPFGGFVNTLAGRVGGSASAGAVYGSPVEQDGVTVIPVARVRSFFGGGGGVESAFEGDTPDGGQGGGGFASAHPVGFIELRDGEAEFRPIKDETAPVMLVLAGCAGAWLVLRGLRSLFH